MRKSAVAVALLTSGLFSACGGSTPAASVTSVPLNALTGQPDTDIGSLYFVGASNLNGDASNLHLDGLHWGRLVDIKAKGSGVVMSDFVISQDIRDGSVFAPSVGPVITYHLSRNPLTDQYLLQIGSPENTQDTINEVEPGSVRFQEALANLESNLTPIFDNSLSPDELGPFSMVPRNAAVVATFNDLLEPVYRNGAWRDSSQGNVANPDTGQLDKSLVQFRTGYPPVSPFETWVILDPNHGNLADLDGDGISNFYSTRIIMSSTVSNLDALASDPPLAINSIGFPESVVVSDANLAVRIPSLVNPGLGQTQVLRNASGRVMSYTGNGSHDNSTGTLDIVRAMRAGGTLTQDPHNGFLRDDEAPSILGDLGVTTQIQDANFSGCEDCTQMALTFDALPCQIVKVGDILTQNTPAGVVSGIVQGWKSATGITTDPSSVSNVTNEVIVQTVLNPNGATYQNLSPARLGTRYSPPDPDSMFAGDPLECFVRFSPEPGTPPNIDVHPTATAFLRFSEPMDPRSLTAFDSFRIEHTNTGGIDRGFQFAVGRVVPTADLRNFRWEHTGVPFKHTTGSAESFTVTIESGAAGPRDLSGNALEADLEPVAFTLDDAPGVEGHQIDGFALRFNDPVGDLFNDQFPEVRDKQIILDLGNERIVPRPVTRFSAAADTNQLIVSVMTSVPGVQTPLSNLGSKLQTLWRYADVGFTVSDETNFNLDVEGISWAPLGGGVAAEIYNSFSISLAHSFWQPDELIDFGPPIISVYPLSGLKPAFNTNLNNVNEDPLKVVHHKSKGYILNSANLFTSTSGRPMIPFPLNETGASADRVYYTWRDTALLALGGGIATDASTGSGAPTDQENLLTGLTAKPHALGEVPTTALPLLMEFRCYPSNEALGLNVFDVVDAALPGTLIRPNFRVHSTGGFVGETANYVDPDNSDIATGGFNPLSNPPGAVTPNQDPLMYLGELALVTRISRVHSVFFDAGGGSTTFAEPVIEPQPNEQPDGTFVNIAYRGVDAATVPNGILAGSTTGTALNVDPYGNNSGANSLSGFVGGPSWKDNISEINNSRYFQFRLSFISNAATDRTPEVRTLAFAWEK